MTTKFDKFRETIMESYNFKEYYKLFFESNGDEMYIRLATNPRKNEKRLQKLVNDAAKKNKYNIGPVFHGTTKMFNVFDIKKSGSYDRGLWGLGHYFTTRLDIAISYAARQDENIRIIKAFISLKNPFFLKTGEDLITRMPDGTNVKTLIGYNLDGSKIKKIALDGGHDGVIQILKDGRIGDLVVYFPWSIKLSDSVTYNDNGEIIPLSQRFDSNKNDIRY